jgi:hypothetical protein
VSPRAGDDLVACSIRSHADAARSCDVLQVGYGEVGETVMFRLDRPRSLSATTHEASA